jgi:hypothetical protein
VGAAMPLPLTARARCRAAFLILSGMISLAPAPAATSLDREALVRRHSPRLEAIDSWAPLSVGNGQFCFTADVTGLQTLYTHYQRNGIPLETQARWAWHEEPNPQGFTLDDANRPFTAYGRTVAYPTNERTPAGQWLRANPHAQPLPRLAFEDARPGAAPLAPDDVAEVVQTLDLWRGRLDTSFRLRGAAVSVTVACHPDRDLLAVRIESAALAEGWLRVRLELPRGHDPKVKNNPRLDFSAPETHTTTVEEESARRLALRHTRDASVYHVRLDAAVPLRVERTGPHAFRFAPVAGARCEFTLAGAAGPVAGGAAVAETLAAAAEHWGRFWRRGGAIDFSGSTDPRARELERRVVLSQYLTAIQFAGDFPPSETGLTHSSWYQKHHTEMVWWHAAHFALWGRGDFLARQLDAYVRALPRARAIARSRGLEGARWPKMTGPDWRESPGGNPLIVWNQPHPIHLAELLYRAEPSPATLARYRDLVLETAAAMASMLEWDAAERRYNLGPPLWIAQEIYDQATSRNPTYELAYWRHGVAVAQQWRERLGLGREAEWDRRVAALAPLPQKDGRYVAVESHPDTWENRASRHDHPSFLMALGQLPGNGVDRAVMARTLAAVLASWDWEAKIWGWDYPMVAMTAARLGEREQAVAVLLKSDSPNNRYTAAGHCPQRGDLPVYLPANGALLAAVAMMTAGWDDAPAGEAPGFPRDGRWVVRHEGLHRLP